jgi:hypothetical protein
LGFPPCLWEYKDLNYEARAKVYLGYLAVLRKDGPERDSGGLRRLAASLATEMERLRFFTKALLPALLEKRQQARLDTRVGRVYGLLRQALEGDEVSDGGEETPGVMEISRLPIQSLMVKGLFGRGDLMGWPPRR